MAYEQMCFKINIDCTKQCWSLGEGNKIWRWTHKHPPAIGSHLQICQSPPSQETFGKALFKTRNRFWEEVSPLHLPPHPKPPPRDSNSVRPITEYQTRKGRATPSSSNETSPEAQRGQVACSRSHSKSAAELALETKPPNSCVASQGRQHVAESENCTMSL